MSSSSKVLLCERVIFPTYRAPAADKNEDEDVAGADEKIAPQPLLANWGDPYTTRLDLQVLACLNGRERTVAQHSDIVSKAGLVLAKVWKGIGGEAILECRLKQPNA